MQRAAVLPSREVALVVVDRAGTPLGRLPAFRVDTPWWQDLEPVLAARPDVVVLRLLDAVPAPGHAMAGRVRYVVEPRRPGHRLDGLVDDLDDATRAALTSDHELRQPWARPGGPAADLAWAASHVELAGEPVQVRAWNLSSIWRLATRDGAVWLKCVPPFFAHEAAVLRRLAGHPVPQLVAGEGHRMLLAGLPGADGYGATVDEHRRIVDVLVGIQGATVGRTGELLGAGVPDWRESELRRAVAGVVARRRPRDGRLQALLERWDERFAAIRACGLPDVLFHGDAHPGNARVGVDPPVVFDWGDCGVGHPLLDLAQLDEGSPASEAVLRHWLAAWRRALPGSDPQRAWELLRPVAAARGAVVFQRFLDGIEPAERVYHEGDVEPFLDRAAALAGASG